MSKWLSFKKISLSGDRSNTELEEEMFGATDLRIKLAGNVAEMVIYVTGVLSYTIDSILLFLNLI